MGLKADWHQGKDVSASASSVDPFDPAECGVMVPSLDELPMVVATIDTPEDELRERLVISVRREARLYQAGISCELKDNAEVTCLACPYSEAENPESKKSGLCRLSKSQDVLLTLLHAKRVGRPVGV